VDTTFNVSITPLGRKKGGNGQAKRDHYGVIPSIDVCASGVSNMAESSFSSSSSLAVIRFKGLLEEEGKDNRPFQNLKPPKLPADFVLEGVLLTLSSHDGLSLIMSLIPSLSLVSLL
jgi:hypothetical protein